MGAACDVSGGGAYSSNRGYANQAVSFANSETLQVSKKNFYKGERSMKKSYLKPSMNVEMFEVMDVVMASGAEFDVSDFFKGVI